MVGERIGQVDAAHIRQFVTGEVVKEGGRAGAAHEVLGEGGGVDDADGVAHGLGLFHGIGPPGATAERPAIVVEVGRGIDRAVVVRALPAVHLTHLRAHLQLTLIGRRRAERAAGLTLFIRVVQDEDVVVAFLVLARGVFGGHPIAVALGVQRGHVDLGLAIHHHLGKVVPRAARRRDAEGEAFCDPHVAQAGNRADQWVAVGGIADWAVEIVLQAHGFGRGNPVDHRHVFRFDPLQIQGEEVGAEAVGDGIFKPRRSAVFVGAKDPAAALFADIPFGVGIAQDRVFAVGLAVFLQHRIGFGHDILVFDRNGRDLDAQKFRRTLGVVAGGGDDMFGVDVIGLCGRHQHAALVLHPGDRDDPFRPGPAIAVDLNLALNRCTMLARALGHGLGHVGGVNVAVLRVVKRTDKVFGPHQGPAVLDLFRGQKLVVDPGGFGDRGIEHVFIHAFLTLGHAQVADHRKARVQAGFCLEPLVEIHRVFVDMGGGVRHVEQGQKARRVPCGACGQLVTFHQHRVPTRLGEVIGNAGANRTAANDKGFDMGFHGETPNGLNGRLPLSARSHRKRARRPDT